MNKDQIVEDFFRSLKVALTNAFSYSKDHPYFVKSVEDFKLKLETLLSVLNPFRIGVTNSGLLVDGKNLARIGFYDELAHLLHQRKIKSIEIRSGSSLQELIQFLSVISLPQKEFFKNGGLRVLLGKERLVNFTIQELDYFAFLQGEGQECADIWGYMLKEAVYSNDAVKIDQLADNFGSFIKRVNEKDLFGAEGVTTEGISTEVSEFLTCLRNKNQEKFDKCLNDIFLWLLRNKKTLSQDKLIKFKPVFDGLSQEKFKALLEEGFLQEDNFDSLSLQLFSKISGEKDSLKIAKDFFSKVNETQGLKDTPEVAKKIRDLLSSSQDDSLSAVYRNTLDSLAKNISFPGKLLFDHQKLKENYRYIVLGILATDQNSDTLQMAATILDTELAGVFKDNDIGLLKDLCSVLAKAKKEGIKACIDLEEKFSFSIEEAVLNGSLIPEQEFLLEFISLPGKELDLYLDKIFTAGKVNKYILSLFLKLFPKNLDIFYSKVEQRLQDTEFLSGLIDALGQLSDPVVLSILDHIYSSANELIKIEILNVMRKLKKVDVEFLMDQLKTDSPSLRKNLITILLLDEQAKNGVLERLFKIPSFLWNKNELLIENMQIVFDLHFVEASSFIKDLNRRRFFWNRKLRAKASQILKEWDVS